jgi:hypothetical protein
MPLHALSCRRNFAIRLASPSRWRRPKARQRSSGRRRRLRPVRWLRRAVCRRLRGYAPDGRGALRRLPAATLRERRCDWLVGSGIRRLNRHPAAPRRDTRRSRSTERQKRRGFDRQQPHRASLGGGRRGMPGRKVRGCVLIPASAMNSVARLSGQARSV